MVLFLLWLFDVSPFGITLSLLTEFLPSNRFFFHGNPLFQRLLQFALPGDSKPSILFYPEEYLTSFYALTVTQRYHSKCPSGPTAVWFAQVTEILRIATPMACPSPTQLIRNGSCAMTQLPFRIRRADSLFSVRLSENWAWSISPKFFMIKIWLAVNSFISAGFCMFLTQCAKTE